MMYYLWFAGRDLLFCFAATFAFSYLMSAPEKSMVASPLIAAAGYLAYDLLSDLGMAMLLAYFTGTVIISAGGELMARFIKVPSILLIYPAVIPLVPGIGLYQTMLYLLQNDYGGFSKTGTQTFLIAGTMAAGIAMTKLTVRFAFKKRNTAIK